MLGNFEIQRPSLCLNKKQANFSDLSGVTDVFLFTPVTYLTLAEALIASNWVRGITEKRIFAIHDIKDSQNESEEPTINESKQNYRYQARKGKYRFTFLVNVDIDYYIKLKKYEGQNLKAIFGDRNGNLIGISDGTNFKPFALSAIIVKKIGFGVYGASSFVGITIDFANPTEMETGYSFKPDFSIGELCNEEVTINSVSSVDVYTMQFTITDSCGNPVIDLVATDFAINDEIHGTLTLHTFTNQGNGVFRYKSTELQYLGEIVLISEKYNGRADYEFVVPQYNPVQYNNSQYKTT